MERLIVFVSVIVPDPSGRRDTSREFPMCRLVTTSLGLSDREGKARGHPKLTSRKGLSMDRTDLPQRGSGTWTGRES
jgi:hypothetical protein